MPASAPYPLLSDILNAARVRVNDSILDIGGNTLVNAYDFTPVYTNVAWRKLQQFLVSIGYVRFKKTNFQIRNLPPVNTPDAGLQVTLSWTRYNDGAVPFPDIVLPQDLIKPLALAERPTNTDQPYNENPFIPIDFPVSVPLIKKQQWNQIADWQKDQITMPGALARTDLMIDYAAYLPDFATDDFPGDQTADILRCENAFSCFLAFVFTSPRGDLDAASFLEEAQDEARIIAGVKAPAMVGV